jgi:hypothetical protein
VKSRRGRKALPLKSKLTTMKNLKAKIELAADKAYAKCYNMRGNAKRIDIFYEELEKSGITKNKVISVYDEKPAKGKSFSVIEMVDRYRVNVRCGYGKHNYAPCVEIKK